ncbi:MAG: hypothetical protein H8E26_08795 [FCB group bacterium]|nr:hypothetical protein [FCB group bacterium]MBL7028911.1 hypothetical protein [Candidatus Neomarinimicrobiota bacterium]MBL7122749.1 hypothetical protein [Candidatus Neomarinimicrobiota bacterium]
MKKLFGNLFILIGIFAVTGGLYTWGDGSIFHQTELVKVLIPWADILLTGPLAIVCGIGILKNREWANILGIATSGIFIFGSLLVFISIIWNRNYAVDLIIPAVSGLIFGVSYIFLSIKKQVALRPEVKELD